MKIYLVIINMIVAIAVITFCMVFHRYSKRIMRRCRCGKFRSRFFKILLLPGEVVSWYDSHGRLRLYVRDVVKLTFAVCEMHGASLVKVDRDPISVWHALYIKRFDPKQYEIEEQTLFGIEQHSMPELLGRRKARFGELPGDPPPLSLTQLFQDLLDNLSDFLKDLSNGKKS